MPFPIMHTAGALFAGVILGATLTLFALVLRATDRAVTRVADGILSGLVSGFREWSDSRAITVPPISPGAGEAEEPIGAVDTEPVRRD